VTTLLSCKACRTDDVGPADHCYGCGYIICWRCCARLGHEHGGRPHALTQKEYEMKTGPKKFYRISPALSDGKNAWVVHHVSRDEAGRESTNTIGYYSLKRAKEVVAHFKKKPIEVPL
jgi:hypothetical protein